MAEAQHGAIGSAQLRACGLTRAAISRWLAAGRLHRVHPRVYALGHPALSLDGRLVAALLFGGEGAAFSHATAAWLWSLVDVEPKRLHVVVAGRRRSLPGVRVHRARRVEAVVRRGLRTTTVARTLLDLAAVWTRPELRRAVAEADYRGLLDLGEVRATLGRGRPGSAALREAIARHLPRLAETLSVLEERFIELCERARLPLPEVNARVGRMRVDALWRDRCLAVELDGGPAHGGAAAMKRDRDRELALRSAGFRVVRYSWEQVTARPAEVVADLRRMLGPPSSAGAAERSASGMSR